MEHHADDAAVRAAIESLRAAVDASPDNPALLASLAQLLLAAGEAGAAIDVASRLLSADPGNGTGVEVLAAATAALTGADPSTAAQRPADHEEFATAMAGSSDPSGRDEIDGLLEELLEQETRDTVLLIHVAGLDAVKARLETSFLGPIRNPALVDYYGASLRGGLLLYGPPGCGKTFVARAVAGELGARFVSVGLHEVLDMYLGNSERQLHQCSNRPAPTHRRCCSSTSSTPWARSAAGCVAMRCATSSPSS